MKTFIDSTSTHSGSIHYYTSPQKPGKSYLKTRHRISRPAIPLASGNNDSRNDLLTAGATIQMMQGQIPDLMDVCFDLHHTFHLNNAPYSALQFVPVIQGLAALDQEELQKFLDNPESRHVLVQNDLLKVVLIHWKPGETSSIHGHPSGGCVFKVLHGQVEELRYTTDAAPKLLSTNTYSPGSIAYIDDQMGYHAVGNPFSSPAISLHAYTPGIKK